MVVTGSVAAEEGYVHEGDYTEEFREYIAARVPGIWERVAFGTEARTLTITETFTVSYPDPSQDKVITDDDLVHGLTFTGPDIDWTVSHEACIEGICAWKFRAGFALDWGFGLRLPMNVSLDSADPVDEGDTFVPTSMADGVDWSAQQFEAAGIPGESGNEFVMRFEFFLGAQVEIAGISVVNVGPDIDENESSSFATPFGPGEVFNLPTIDAPIYSRNLAEVEFEFGAAITPQAGSDRFRANWLASSDLSSGSGQVDALPARCRDRPARRHRGPAAHLRGRLPVPGDVRLDRQ